jgi:hypothetical protein
MKEYVIFAIEQIKIAIEENSEKLYIGYNNIEEDIVKFEISKEAWLDYIKTLKEFAIDEECYEQCKEIKILEEKVNEYLKNDNYR